MTTKYDVIYEWFCKKITDYNLLSFSLEDRESILLGYLKTACTKFHPVDINLLNKNDKLKEFNDVLSDEVIDIITEIMVSEWLRVQVNNIDNFKNSLSTKDFKRFSSANMLEALQKLYLESKNNAKHMVNEYAVRNFKLKQVK